MPHKYWYCGTFDFKKVSKTGLYHRNPNVTSYDSAVPEITK